MNNIERNGSEYNLVMNNFMNSIKNNGSSKLFLITKKCCDYKFLIQVYKELSLKDLYNNLYCEMTIMNDEKMKEKTKLYYNDLLIEKVIKSKRFYYRE